MKEVRLTKTATQDLAAGALAYSYEFDRDGVLDFIEIHFSAACSQTVTVSKDSVIGANYDTVYKTDVLSSATNYTYQPTRPIPYNKGDKILVGITSGGTAVAYMTAHLKEVATWAR